MSVDTENLVATYIAIRTQREKLLKEYGLILQRN
jgi:hypothetical protein